MGEHLGSRWLGYPGTMNNEPEASYLNSAASASIRRWMYADHIANFCSAHPDQILGELTRRSGNDVELAQSNAWTEQIVELQAELRLADKSWLEGKIYFEYSIPRLGRRIDVLLLIRHVAFVLEFKVGERNFNIDAIDQVWDYALDLKNFHETSHSIALVPVLIATKALRQKVEMQETAHNDFLVRPVRAGLTQILETVECGLNYFTANKIDIKQWELGRYLPTPTIVEAARALYAGHAVNEISRSDAGAINLARTSLAVDTIIERARNTGRKSICFVTGVPGAGKTLVGLDVANRHLDKKSETYSVFLSGNGPLVAVLREALVRDKVAQSRASGVSTTKSKAREGVEAFIQNVHHFRDEYLRDHGAPPEHVVLFDEAQRAWDKDQTVDFMRRKKGVANFDQSEPEYLISCMDRHSDWAVIVCLVGSGQEINKGEAGIGAWLEAIANHFPSWEINISPDLISAESDLKPLFQNSSISKKIITNTDLHLATSMRSFRAETLSNFVSEVLKIERDKSAHTLRGLVARYPIVITRNINAAKRWLRGQARGSERYGIVVSSRAERLKPHAIDVRVKTDPVKWFLDGKEDVRSSYYLEDVATEFQVQGLELDWACVVWDGDFRFADDRWSHHAFRGTRWINVNKRERQQYLENTYRVLLTRARQGMVLVVPEGDQQDPTRHHDFYDPTYTYLKSIGLKEI